MPTRTATRLAGWTLACGAACGAGAAELSATTVDPRAYGHQLGDVLSRHIAIEVPAGLALDASSLPQPGVRGGALELRAVSSRHSVRPSGDRIELDLDYQLLASPSQPRMLELPVVTLHFTGQPRDQDLRIDAWPVTVSPLTPADVSPRQGLGELQPDLPPPLIDTSAARLRLLAYAVAIAAIGAWLAHVHWTLPWWVRRHRPFGRAWQALHRLPSGTARRREAFLLVHEALNRTAGETLFEHGVERFVGAHPRYAPLRDELGSFFARSRSEFFGHGPAGGDADDAAWVVELCRRCRDVERGAA